MRKPDNGESGGRGWFGPAYTAEEAAYLRRHVVKMAQGKLETSGDFRTSGADVAKLFGTHLPAALKTAKAAGRPLRVLFWAHGGLVSEKDALRYVLHYGKIWESAGIYPVYFVWKTGILDSFGGLLAGGGQRGWFSDQFSDPLLELSLHGLAGAVWSEIKSFAAAACGARGGASLALDHFRKFHDRHAAHVRCYACGHSAGSIFHAYWLPKLVASRLPVQELFLLAPAANITLFTEKLRNLISSQDAIRHCSMFTMTEAAERRDHVIHLYRKSLLYFVSRACEARKNEPILGMVENLRADPEMREFWGLDAHHAAAAELILSPSGNSTGTRAANSTAHGDFDNDPDTLNSLVRRITGNSALAPFNESNTPRGMGYGGFGNGSPDGTDDPARPLPDLGVTVHLRWGSIEKAGSTAAGPTPAIQYRAAGHYEGTEPMGPERVLDKWVSGIAPHDWQTEGVVGGMTRRGTMGGILGQTVLLPHDSKQFAVFLGLGRYGSLGPAELTTAVRELCLKISQLQGKHLATVLIGGGAGNMTMDAAAKAWLRGIRQAAEAGGKSLKHVTFIEYHADRFLQLEDALAGALRNYRNARLEVMETDYGKAVATAADDAKAKATKAIDGLRQAHQARVLGTEPAPAKAGSDPAPCHISVRAAGDCCCFTAMTSSAAVPERVIRIDPQIVAEIAGAIAGARDPESLRQWGRTLQQLLIPADLQAMLFSSAAPLVMTLDATMAKIPWELLTLPNPGGGLPTIEQFLGLATGFGVTRQLQTGFASIPERDRAKDAAHSVIIVADPAPDASLPGARREAKWVEEFFNTHCPGAAVTCLEGEAATRANLARELCNHTYDILHFAGHCYYNKEVPGKSGWVFRREPLEVFSADELMRLDRVPPFIFSNACETGVTPDRAHLANLAIGPAFAEAFFAKGVSNFVCTGWPVDDRAALAFAKAFYPSLFLDRDSIREAMLKARQTIARISWQTVGAYQHYGSPSHRFRNQSQPATGRN